MPSRISWHRDPQPDTTPAWVAEIGGVQVAQAFMTGRAGVDNYPWEWSLTTDGVALALRSRHTGVTDTLRTAKTEVLAQFT